MNTHRFAVPAARFSIAAGYTEPHAAEVYWDRRAHCCDSHGDFVESDLEDALREADIIEHGVRAYKEHAADRKVLVFLPGVALAHDIADAFKASGVNAAAIDGSTHIELRRDILQRFQAGEIPVLANCMVLTEGFDCPSIDCVMIARPTQSRPLYTQMVGRGTRVHPGKSNLLVLDFVSATTRHELVTVPTLFGVELQEGETVGEAVARQEAEAIYGGSGDEGELVAYAVDIFKNARYRWIDNGGVFSLSIGNGTLVLNQDTRGFTTTLFRRGQSPLTLASNMSLEYAQGIGEDYARKEGVAAILNPAAPWP